MTLYFEEEGTFSLPFLGRELAEKAAEAVLDYVKCPYETQVNVLLTMNEQIQEMNRDFRGIDRATDVLSFPMNEYKMPEDFEGLESSEASFDPESGELLLGDIVISKEKVISQADEFGHSKEREYAFLIVHSVLHLIGHDHIEEEDRLIMEAEQKEILEILNILR